MTTASQIITDAYREGNLIPVGREPTDAESTEALARLNNFIEQLFGTTLGEYIMDWTVPPSRTAPVSARFPLKPGPDQLPRDVWPYLPNNVRIVSKVQEATTIYLPFYPNDGAQIGLADTGSTADLTIDANGRKIEGSPTLTIAPADVGSRRWMYRADLGDWIRIDALALTDDSPLPAEFDDLLICWLNMRLSPRSGRDPLPVTVQTYDQMRRKVKTRYKQDMPMTGTYDAHRLSMQAHLRGYDDYDDGGLYR